MIKLILIIISIFLFCFGYQICFIFYPDFKNHADEWFDLRDIIYALMLCVSYSAIVIKPSEKYAKITDFFTLVGIGLIASHCIDLIFFNCKTFTWSDIIMILITFISSYSKVYVRRGSKIIK